MLRKYDETVACIILREGDKVMYMNSSPGKIDSIRLLPNGVNDARLIAQLTVSLEDGRKVTATSDKFKPVIGELYLDY